MLETGQLVAGQPMGLVKVHTWLSLIGPKLEVGTKVREAVSYQALATWGQLL